MPLILDDGFTSLSLVGAEPFSYQRHIYQRTPWFVSEAPVHHGAYERNIHDLRSNQPMYGYWDGVVWYQCAHSPERAEQLYFVGYESCYQYTDINQSWRGLMEQR